MRKSTQDSYKIGLLFRKQKTEKETEKGFGKEILKSHSQFRASQLVQTSLEKLCKPKQWAEPNY